MLFLRGFIIFILYLAPIINISFFFIFVLGEISYFYVKIALPLAFLCWVTRQVLLLFQDYIFGFLSSLSRLITVEIRDNKDDILIIGDLYKKDFVIILSPQGKELGFSQTDIPLLTNSYI